MRAWPVILHLVAMAIGLVAAGMIAGCGDHGKTEPGKSAAAAPSEDTLLFSRLGAKGCAASHGLVSFAQELKGPWVPNDQGEIKNCFACSLGFCPSAQGCGLLYLDGDPIPEKPQDPEKARTRPWWNLKRGASFHPLGNKAEPFCLTGHGSAKKISIEKGSPPHLPQVRLLTLKVRGARFCNRYPTLKVTCGETTLFDEVIPHPKPECYKIPFVQTAELEYIEISAGLSEASIPVWADHSEQGEEQASLMIDEVLLSNAPMVVVHMPEVTEKARAGFEWVEFPERVYAAPETLLFKEPSEELKALFLKTWAMTGEKLGRTTMPAIKIRKPALFEFPVVFGPGSRRLTFSVGLTAAYRNHVFVEVSATTDASGSTPVKLVDEVVAQPLLEPEPMWKDFAVDLPRALSGKGRLTFRFLNLPSASEAPPDQGKTENNGADGSFAYALFSSPRIFADKKTVIAKPNAILISIDTLRADHLSCYGYAFATSPHIDGLAKEAVLFSNALSSSSWTLPAHLALLNGVPLGQHGGPFKNRRIAPGIPTLASCMQRQGYATAAFVGGGYVSAEFGMDKGFDLFDEQSLTVSSGFAGVSSWLEANGKASPFFLFFHFFDVHSPYGDRAEDPRRFFTESGCYFDEGLAREIREGRYTHENTCGSFKIHVSDQARQHMIHLYDADILEVDFWLDKLFSLLKEQDLFDGTTIIVTSDHGEEFGEHGNWHHSKHLYEEVVHVPMIVKLPARATLAEKRVDTP
ncbi:MAG: sulfatase, partial [Planctomycetota bacterium]